MNSNASKTFSLVKGRKRIRETLNSVTSAGFIGRGEPITLPEAKRESKICNGSSAILRAVRREESDSALTYRAASNFEMKYPVPVHSIFHRTYISTSSNDCVIRSALRRSYPDRRKDRYAIKVKY